MEQLQAHHAHRDRTDRVLKDRAHTAHDLTDPSAVGLWARLAQLEPLQQEAAVLIVADLVAVLDTATHADHHAVPLPARAVPKTQASTANTFCLQQKVSFASSHSAVSKKSERT